MTQRKTPVSSPSSFQLSQAVGSFGKAIAGLAFSATVSACGNPQLVKRNSLQTTKEKALAAHVSSLMQAIPTPGSISTRKIIGDNNLVPVVANGSNVPSQFRDLLDAFGSMSMSCTATHVGHGIVVTAGHCFRATSVRQDKIDCQGIKVEWGRRANLEPYLVSNCEQVLAQETSDGADYAIFKVDEAPRATARLAAGRPQLGQSVTIFGHPKDRPLEWSGFCDLLSPTNGGFDQADFSHQCDTEVGNSGSTVLNAQSGEVLGIHDGGVSPYNYGTFAASTPLQEFEPFYSGRQDVPPLESEKGDLAFGKLDLGNDQSDKLLAELSKPGAAIVNFKITVNLEGAYDSVVLEDAAGHRSGKITGKESFDMNGLKAPMKVLFSSDSSGLSTLVKISKINYL